MRHKVVPKIGMASIFSLIIMLNTLLVDTVTWSDETRLTTHEEFDGLPSIAQAGNGKIWVAWQSRRTTNPDIFYKVYDGSWTDPEQLTSDPNQDTGPSILHKSDGTTWVFWSTNRHGDFELYYVRSSDGGTSWWSEQRLTTNSSDDQAPSAIEASDGTIWVVWQRLVATGNRDIFCKTSSDGGMSWSDEEQLTTHPSLDKLPSIAQMSDGRIWVVWGSLRTDNYEVFYKIHDGSMWLGVEQLTVDANSDTDPAIVEAVDGTIVVVWSSRKPTTTAYDDLYYKNSSTNGVTWSDSFQLTTDPGTSDDDMWPSIAQIDDGRLWVAFTSNINDNYDIYYKISNLIVVHDVAMESCSYTAPLYLDWAYQGNTIQVHVDVKNEGTVTETLDVVAYYDSATAGTTTITDLNPKSMVATTIFWDTTDVSPGSYVISATAQLSGETDPDDNSKTDGFIRIRIAGNVDGDGDVDIADLVWIARALGTDSSMTWGTGWDEYNPDADIDRDGSVGLFDLYIAAKNYGMVE